MFVNDETDIKTKSFCVCVSVITVILGEKQVESCS